MMKKQSEAVSGCSIVCPVCGRNFVPAPYHVYRSSAKVKAQTKLVCSYSCAQASRREFEANRKHRAGRQPIYAYILPSGEIAVGQAEAMKLMRVPRDRLMYLIAHGDIKKILRGEIGV